MMVPGVVNTAAFQIWLSGGCGQYCAKYPAPGNGPDTHSPLVQDFNFHTNLKSDHKLPCIQRSRLTLDQFSTAGVDQFCTVGNNQLSCCL